MNTASQSSTQRKHRPPSVIVPRALREKEAAQYLGLSPSFLRNTRVADMRALRESKPGKGPRWVTLATAVRYLVTDLDAWLVQHRVGGAA